MNITTRRSKPFFVFAILLTLLVLAACSAQATITPTAPATPPAAVTTPTRQSASFVSAKTDQYELYAPTDSDLNKAKAELDYAVQQFKRYFGENAPKIGVVIADNPNQAQPYLDQFKKAGLSQLVYSYKIDANGNGNQPMMVGGAGGEVLPTMGLAVAVEAGKGLKIVEVVPIGPLKDSDLKKDDIITSFNGASVTSGKELSALYDKAAANSKLEFKVLRQGKEQTVAVTKPEGNGGAMPVMLTPSAGQMPPGDEQVAITFNNGSSSSLSGQAGAKFFELFNTTKGGQTKLADWYTEAVSGLHEPVSTQQAQRTKLRQALSSGTLSLSFSQLFSMSNPALKSDTMANAGAVSTPLPSSLSAEIFSPEALSVAQFLADKEGADFIGKIADGLRQGKTMPEILKSAKNLPTSLDELERAWLVWVQK